MRKKPNGERISLINNILSTKFNCQGWWPINGVYRAHNYFPDNENDKFEIAIGAILTQNCTWVNAEKALSNLRTYNMLSPLILQESTQTTISRLIKSSGYYNQKTIKIKAFCSFITEYSFDTLSRIPINIAREKLLSVHGIGRETADSILLYALGKPSFVVDSYTKRILTRVGIIDDNISYDELKIFVERYIPPKTEIYNELHTYFVKLAKDNCRKIPICGNCPINSLCAYYKLRYNSTN